MNFWDMTYDNKNMDYFFNSGIISSRGRIFIAHSLTESNQMVYGDVKEQ